MCSRLSSTCPTTTSVRTRVERSTSSTSSTSTSTRQVPHGGVPVGCRLRSRSRRRSSRCCFDPTNTPVTPLRSAFTNPATVEFVAQTGVVYKRTDTGAYPGCTSPLDATTLPEVTVEATSAAGYYFTDNLPQTDSHTYEYGDPTG